MADENERVDPEAVLKYCERAFSRGEWVSCDIGETPAAERARTDLPKLARRVLELERQVSANKLVLDSARIGEAESARQLDHARILVEAAKSWAREAQRASPLVNEPFAGRFISQCNEFLEFK